MRLKSKILTREAKDLARRAAARLAERPVVRLVFLFGAATDPTAGRVRDIDLAVLTDSPLGLEERLRLHADLAGAVGGPIDLISLNEASVALAREVADHGMCLYARSASEEVGFITRARSRYWDFKPFLAQQWRFAAERQEARRRGTQAEALRARLLKLEEVLSRLEELQAVGPSDDFRDAWAVERGLLLAAEIVFDVGNHILSAHFGVSAEDYEDILEQLARQGVIPRELRSRLEGLGGFRNILVHGYLRLDPARIREKLVAAPADFSEFGSEVRGWLESTFPPPR